MWGSAYRTGKRLAFHKRVLREKTVSSAIVKLWVPNKKALVLTYLLSNFVVKTVFAYPLEQ
jgi:hypothetical protein